MSEVEIAAIAEILWQAVATYLAIGLATSVCFVLFGIHRALPDAGHVTMGARLLLVPGATLLWPIVLRRWGRR